MPQWFPRLAQQPDKLAEKHILALLDAEGERLRHQNAAEAVDRQTGEEVRLAENQTAAGKVGAHNGAPVVDSVLQAARKESFAEVVVGVAGDHTQANF